MLPKYLNARKRSQFFRLIRPAVSNQILRGFVKSDCLLILRGGTYQQTKRVKFNKNLPEQYHRTYILLSDSSDMQSSQGCVCQTDRIFLGALSFQC